MPIPISCYWTLSQCLGILLPSDDDVGGFLHDLPDARVDCCYFAERDESRLILLNRVGCCYSGSTGPAYAGPVSFARVRPPARSLRHADPLDARLDVVAKLSLPELMDAPQLRL
jgi:hypothetical protein